MDGKFNYNIFVVYINYLIGNIKHVKRKSSFIKSLESRGIVEFDEDDDMYMVNKEYSLTCDHLEVWAIELADNKIILIDENGADCFYPYTEFKKEEYRCMQTITL